MPGDFPSAANQTLTTPREEILRKLRERIVAFAASRMQKDAAEDLAQEVLIVLHQRYAALDRIGDLLPLALQILRFKLMAARRKSTRRGEYTQLPAEELPLPDKAPSPLLQAERKQMLERLTAAIAQLGERCKQIFALKLEGKTFTEIQTTLGAGSINTVYAWDFRCRKQLLHLMGGSWRTTDDK